MSALVNISGCRFGLLTAAYYVGKRNWLCICECGCEVLRSGIDLRMGRISGQNSSCRSCQLLNLVGQKFGVLTVLKRVGTTPSGALWECHCSCGSNIIKVTSALKRSPNIGCADCETQRRSHIAAVHGGAIGGKSKLYNVWKSMRARCSDLENPNYGGKGIHVCREWEDFAVFRYWAHDNGYANGLSIDRMNPKKGYNPKNCEWVTKSENGRRIRNPKIKEAA